MKRNIMLLALFAFLFGSSLLVVRSRSKVGTPEPATVVVHTAASSAPKEDVQGVNPGNKGMTDQRGVPPSSIGGKESRLDVVIDGRIIHLRNGGKVFLDDGLSVEVFLDPYPPTTLRIWLDLYLTRDAGSQAISDAEAVIEYDMRYMYHGLLRGKAKNLG
ncbi:MAG: hypothetical protein HY731_08385, partial [Candidatus Tectomicrobia bacterium]|nr:hypothetical protein [Candidatus Tectomicrobia bacterium]